MLRKPARHLKGNFINVFKVERDKFPWSLSSWNDSDVLFCEGNPEILGMACVSVIGTRKVSEVGRRRAIAITRFLAQANTCIVSGLAKGIDAIAHETALGCGGKTIAVLGTPLDRIYPVENLELRREIETRGLVISQFPNGAKTFKSSFPKRNRLMAALSHLTVVVEASETSGTRHQVHAALQLGRSVALPVSLAESGFEWVGDAMKTGRVHVLHELSDLTPFLS